MKKLTHASTFSGIGAPEVAADMLGWDNLFHCEITRFGRAVLDYYFPNAKSYEDITKTDFSEWRGKVNVLTGGFPCQPFSYAGKRRGSEDDRYLWPYMLRCIEQVQPDWFIGENVAGITTMVFPGEDVTVGSHADLFGEGDAIIETHKRYVLNDICEGLERAGYSVQPILIPACAVGAPHRRDRVWIIAHRDAVSTPQTPTAVTMNAESPEQFKARKKRNGYANGTTYGSLSSQIMYDPRCKDLLPTPLAVEVEHKSRVDELKATGATDFHSRANGEIRPNGLMDYLRFKDMLPTPDATEGEHYTNTYNPNSQRGRGLGAMAGSGMLPTPIKNSCPKTDGEPFRLSPLFTEEMMGFPLMWTTLPFLSASGRKKVLKHTATPGASKSATK